MTWARLLAESRVDRHTTSPEEQASYRAVVERNLADAAVEAISADTRFGCATTVRIPPSQQGLTRSSVTARSWAGARPRGKPLDVKHLHLRLWNSEAFDRCR